MLRKAVLLLILASMPLEAYSFCSRPFNTCSHSSLYDPTCFNSFRPECYEKNQYYHNCIDAYQRELERYESCAAEEEREKERKRQEEEERIRKRYEEWQKRNNS